MGFVTWYRSLMRDFCRFARQAALQLCFSAVIVVATFGRLLFSDNIGIDTETLINVPRSILNWLSIGREGVVASKYALGTLGFNMYWAEFLGISFLLLALLAFGFLLWRLGCRKWATFLVFPLVFATHPVFVEQFYFTTQMAEFSFAMLMVPVALLLIYEGARSRSRVGLAAGWVCAALLFFWASASYQSFLALELAGGSLMGLLIARWDHPAYEKIGEEPVQMRPTQGAAASARQGAETPARIGSSEAGGAGNDVSGGSCRFDGGDWQYGAGELGGACLPDNVEESAGTGWHRGAVRFDSDSGLDLDAVFYGFDRGEAPEGTASSRWDLRRDDAVASGSAPGTASGNGTIPAAEPDAPPLASVAALPADWRAVTQTDRQANHVRGDDRDLFGREKRRVFVRTALSFASCFIVAALAYVVVTRLWFTGSDYLTSQVQWGTASVAACLNNIAAAVGDMTYGDGVFYTCAFAVAAILLATRYVVDLVVGRLVGYRVFCLFAGILLLASPFLLPIAMANAPAARTAFTLPFAVAASGAVVWEGVGRKLPGLAVKRLAMVVCVVLVVCSQSATSMRLLYTDEVSWRQSTEFATTLCHDLDNALGGSDKPVIFIGCWDPPLDSTCLKGEYIGVSEFHWGDASLPHYHRSTQIVLAWLRSIGHSYFEPTPEQVIEARKIAQTMSLYPDTCEIYNGDDFVVVKLGPDLFYNQDIGYTSQGTLSSDSSNLDANEGRVV